MLSGPSIFDERIQRRLPNHLVRIAQLGLNGLRHLRPVEARQDVDDVDAGDRVLAFDAADQLGIADSSASSPMILNSAAFSFASWL